MIVDRALISDSIQGSSGSLGMVYHTLIDVLLANVYLNSPYYKGHCKVMCVSSLVYPVIIGNVRVAHQMLPDPDWKAKHQRGARARTSGGNKTGFSPFQLLYSCLVRGPGTIHKELWTKEVNSHGAT